MSADLVEVVHDLQQQLSKRGASAFRTLELAFEVNDRDKNGIFDFAEIEAILGRAGLFLKRQQLTKLYRHFDHDQTERVFYPELLSAIRGPLSDRRANIVHQVFDKLDASGHGTVDVQKIISSFDASRHPHVLSGERKAAEVTRDFALAFEGAGAGNNGAVSRQEFLQFYHGISAATPYDDDYFVNLVSRTFGVKEFIPNSLAATVLAASAGRSTSLSATGAAPSVSPLLERVRAIFREKIRQKTVNTKSEIDNLRSVFKFFDLSNSGLIGLADFKKAVQRFGIYLDDATLEQLFAEFDEHNTGRIDYLRFATELYKEDQSSAAYHQFQRSQALKATAAAAAAGSRAQTPGGSREYLDSRQVLLSSSKGAGAPQPAADAAPLSKRAPARRTLSQKERETSVLPTVLFLLGAAGAGSSTQIARLVREFGFTHLRVSDLLAGVKGEVNEATVAATLAKAIQEHVHRGSLYFIVDKYPATLAARQAWEQTTQGKVDTPFVVYLEAPQRALEQRISAKARAAGSRAPTREQFEALFAPFAKDTIQVINSYGQEGRLQVIDAAASAEEVYTQIAKVVAEL